MKISGIIGPNGKIERQIDFEGALLPDGRSIDKVLEENESLKAEVGALQKKISNDFSILVSLVHNKTIRIIVEITLIVLTVIGVIALF